ncbi:MAG: hypothetical protein EBR82_87180 [Caulobacteraceae bacterium]|nr:hypothetical protein [Caulobacteraceae bacterium]
MTQDYPHPITPPPELVQQWINEEDGLTAGHIATRAAQWGWDQREPEIQAVADQELEACCHYFARDLRESLALELRAARRPKPPSLKEQALAELQISDERGYLKEAAVDTIRRALEQLDD